jgi:hypothetical protein
MSRSAATMVILGMEASLGNCATRQRKEGIRTHVMADARETRRDPGSDVEFPSETNDGFYCSRRILPATRSRSMPRGESYA